MSDPPKEGRKRTGHRAGAARRFADRVRDLVDAHDRGVDLLGHTVLPRLR